MHARPRRTGYTDGVTEQPFSAAQPGSLRADQVAQTRAALTVAGRQLPGQHGFAATSVQEPG